MYSLEQAKQVKEEESDMQTRLCAIELPWGERECGIISGGECVARSPSLAMIVCEVRAQTPLYGVQYVVCEQSGTPLRIHEYEHPIYTKPFTLEECAYIVQHL